MYIWFYFSYLLDLIYLINYLFRLDIILCISIFVCICTIDSFCLIIGPIGLLLIILSSIMFQDKGVFQTYYIIYFMFCLICTVVFFIGLFLVSIPIFVFLYGWFIEQVIALGGGSPNGIYPGSGPPHPDWMNTIHPNTYAQERKDEEERLFNWLLQKRMQWSQMHTAQRNEEMALVANVTNPDDANRLGMMLQLREYATTDKILSDYHYNASIKAKLKVSL